jgi:hypothetical protein
VNSAFVKRLLAVAPQFRVAYTRHLKGNDELLPHVFMGDVTREVIAACKNPSELVSVKALLPFFESELKSGDAEATDLISASFCENLIGETHAIEVLLPLMGPSLRQVLGRTQ